MPTTKKKLAEQVLYRLKGGITDVSFPVQQEDVIEAIGQMVNALLKTQHFQLTLQSGETIPENLMIATYPSVAVTTYGTKAKASLPAIPISLPRNMGVYEVSPCEDFSELYIPLQAGQANLLKSQPLISDLLGQVGYETYSNQIVFTKDITIDDVNNIYLRLIIMDIAKYSEYEPLPIPADYEGVIVDELVKKFAPTPPNQSIIDNYSEPK